MSKEDYSSLSGFLEGILIPSPPSRTRRAKRSLSRSLCGRLPVRAGSKSVLNTVSRGVSRWPMLAVTRLRYVHFLSRLCRSAEKVAWGCDFAISLRRVILDDHDQTFAFTYSSVYSWEPMAAPR